MTKYQGHKNYNHWNVALYLNNDYGTYKLMQECVEANPGNRDKAAYLILNSLGEGAKTPDGVPYTFTTVRAALVGWES